MKIRKGFVSNSSSSSFICDVCGESYSGWDATLDEAEMFECVHGHTVCLSHAVEEIDQESEEYPYSISSKYCPICMFNALETESAFKYLLKMTGKTKQTLLNELRHKFDSYEKFLEYLK